MKIVAVSQRIDDYPDRNERRDALDQKLSVFVYACGFVPVSVPNQLVQDVETRGSKKECNELGVWLSVFKPNAILLSGGNDIGSCNDRDLTEKSLIDFAAIKNLPVLGICRGMQMMGTFAGSKLIKVPGHVGTRHCLQGGVISGEVNSFHSMSLESCPSGYEILAKSEDGGIEAMRHEKLPWEGWMWHPEREECFNPNDIQRLKNLFV